SCPLTRPSAGGYVISASAYWHSKTTTSRSTATICWPSCAARTLLGASSPPGDVVKCCTLMRQSQRPWLSVPQIRRRTWLAQRGRRWQRDTQPDYDKRSENVTDQRPN